MGGLREQARLAATRHAPGLLGVRWMVAERVRGEAWLQPEVGPHDDALGARLGEVVHGGPFAGLALPVDAVCSERWPKLVGTYEDELAEALAVSLGRAPAVAVNVGAAEGYYAVGLARAGVPRVVAVDPLARSRRRVREVARANDVEGQVEVRALATCRRLDRWLVDGGLVVMDCEGTEYGLLDPRRAPNLAGADILVEVHEFAVAGLGDALAERFAPTHDLTWIDQRPRDPQGLAALDGLAPEVAAVAVAEHRPARLRWAHLLARAVR